MGPAAVVNASPLIFLAKLGKLEALGLFEPVFTTPQVMAEVTVGLERGFREALSVRRLVAENTIEIREAPSLKLPPPRLDPGELSVIALASQVKGAIAVIDDLAAIRAAKHFGVRVRSTPFVLLDNVVARRIEFDEFRALLDRLLALEYHLSTALFLELVALGEEAARS
jgi:predicted nucleic acid-binding protein